MENESSLDRDMEVKLYVEKQQLHINCLFDPDRHIRLRGIDTLTKNIFPSSKDKIQNLYIKSLLEKLISPLLKCFEDKIEKIRQMSIDLVIKLVDNLELEDKYIGLILNEIISRLNHVPFPESSEELRIRLVELLNKILIKSPGDLVAVIADLCTMISKLLTDTFPEIKTKLSEFLIQMTGNQSISKVMGPHTKGMVISMCGNLKHAHNKIRKITINALIDVLKCDTAGKFFEEAIPLLKVVSNDNNYDVRKTFYAAIYKLLTNWNITYLRKYEHLLVMFLINGLSDDKIDIQANCDQYIEQAGEYRLRLAAELEEDLSESADGQIMVDQY